MTNQATRIIVKAAGELSADGAQEIEDEGPAPPTGSDDFEELDKQALQALIQEGAAVINIESYVPRITDDRRWVLSETDLGKMQVPLIDMTALTPLIFRVDRGWMRSIGYWGRWVAISPLLSCPAAATGRPHYQC